MAARNAPSAPGSFGSSTSSTTSGTGLDTPLPDCPRMRSTTGPASRRSPRQGAPARPRRHRARARTARHRRQRRRASRRWHRDRSRGRSPQARERLPCRRVSGNVTRCRRAAQANLRHFGALTHDPRAIVRGWRGTNATALVDYWTTPRAMTSRAVPVGRNADRWRTTRACRRPVAACGRCAPRARDRASRSPAPCRRRHSARASGRTPARRCGGRGCRWARRRARNAAR